MVKGPRVFHIGEWYKFKTVIYLYFQDRFLFTVEFIIRNLTVIQILDWTKSNPLLHRVKAISFQKGKKANIIEKTG